MDYASLYRQEISERCAEEYVETERHRYTTLPARPNPLLSPPCFPPHLLYSKTGHQKKKERGKDLWTITKERSLWTQVWWAISSNLGYYTHVPAKGKNIRLNADTGQDKSLVMKVQLTWRPRMQLSCIKLNRTGEELCLIAVFCCRKAWMALGKNKKVKKGEILPEMLLKLAF